MFSSSFPFEQKIYRGGTSHTSLHPPTRPPSTSSKLLANLLFTMTINLDFYFYMSPIKDTFLVKNNLLHL